MEKQETLISQIRRVFEYWKEVTKHPRSRLDLKREQLIGDRLRSGYTVEDLMTAALGCATDRWHQGENNARMIYDSIELIYRNSDKVDYFVRLGELEQWRREEAKRAEQVKREETLKASVPGEGYRNARGQLLQLVKKERAA